MSASRPLALRIIALTSASVSTSTSRLGSFGLWPFPAGLRSACSLSQLRKAFVVFT